MDKLLYFFKYILHPIRENFDKEDGFKYLEDYVILKLNEIVDLFYNELDWFAPSNGDAEDFFDWYE